MIGIGAGSVSPQDPSWWYTHTPKYYFPKSSEYREFAAPTFIFLAATLGLGNSYSFTGRQTTPNVTVVTTVGSETSVPSRSSGVHRQHFDVTVPHDVTHGYLHQRAPGSHGLPPLSTRY